MNFFLVVFSLTISTILCQVPTPCTSPPQWESRYFSYDTVQKAMVRARISYDAVYKRERIIEEFRLGDDDEYFDVLYLHNQQIEYRYNLKTKECQKQPITRPWTDYGVPKNSTSYGESYIGSAAVPNANILVTIWGNEFVDQKGNKIEYMGVWSLEGCLPISANYWSDTGKISTHSNFFDITPGIDNPDVFIPRKECLSL